MKRKANQPLKADANARTVAWTVKLSERESVELSAKVAKLAGGLRSLYIRAALLNYKPKKEDFHAIV